MAGMESRKRRDYVYCDHCDQLVTKSTYRRHQLMRGKRKRNPVESSSSGGECDCHPGLDNDLDQAKCEATTVQGERIICLHLSLACQNHGT